MGADGDMKLQLSRPISDVHLHKITIILMSLSIVFVISKHLLTTDF